MNAYYAVLWLVGFIISFAVGYIFLRLAKAQKASASRAFGLRTAAVLLAVLLTSATSFDGLNAGAIIATFAILGMALFRRPA
ncbi:MAG TPA: hypothetical protein VK753_12695 [Xanthomonadaceae bacterium]|nr:hypothetical protein [Xanthomonadaceae bacterium]